MSSLETAIELAKQGYFTKALHELEDSRANVGKNVSADVHKAVLLERVGRLKQSSTLLVRLANSRSTTPSQRSLCEFALGRIDWEEGRRKSAVDRYRHAIKLAEDVNDLTQKCWAAISLLAALSDSSAREITAQMLSELRWDVLRLGDPHLLAALHAHMGSMEAKRGLFDGAKSHLRRASRLLATHPNVFLEALVELTTAVIALLTLEFETAAVHAQRSLTLSENSGSLVLQRACLANLAFCHYATGHFEAASRQLQRATSILPPAGEIRNGVLDTQARIYLAQGRVEEAARLVDEIENTIGDDNRHAFAHRYVGVLKAELLARSGKFDSALAQIELTLADAETSDDIFLNQQARLHKAYILHLTNHNLESMAILSSWITGSRAPAPGLYAQYETVLACMLASVGSQDCAKAHSERAERTLTSLHYKPGLIELSRCLALARSRANESSNLPGENALSDRAIGATRSIQSVAALLAQFGKPETIARHLIDLLANSGVVVCAAATISAADSHEVLACAGNIQDTGLQELPRRLSIGIIGGRLVSIAMLPKTDVESTATINAVAQLVSATQELERARAEREERLTLWPIEDVPVMHEHAVVNGKMSQLMMTARRVAPTTISVLLTGESGTGKEILARAIHTFSDRADHPFVPFNCAALPRDMLESQLFGHRRGAFTGADRDNPGVIRAARNGTLFLDEIGELSLGLQPKLLRFLESGEIWPLGDTGPSTVNVRIIAATNVKLDEAVKHGRFREDLFYRLNVVRLAVPPLRERRDELPSLVHHFVTKAALEYRKGRIRIAENTMERLLLAPWPGNIRQLQNELRRMIALADADAVLTPASLSSDVAGAADEAAAQRDQALGALMHGKLNPAIARLEREMIRAALEQHHGNMNAAATSLGISRKGLYLKRQRHGL